MRTALDYLAFGDAIQQRMRLGRATTAQVADDMGISHSVAAKASWLAAAFTAADRARLGHSTLRALNSSQLEAVACLPEPARSALLRRAAKEGLGVRALKELAPSAAATPGSTPTTSIGAPQVAKAVDTYLHFDDEQLRRLLAGPNGPTIKRLARSGAELAARIARARHRLGGGDVAEPHADLQPPASPRSAGSASA